MQFEDGYVAGNPGLNGSEKMIVISGCSCGGKSTLLTELSARGYCVQPESGRQIVKEQLYIGGDGLPWVNARRFFELCLSRSMFHYNNAAPTDKPAVFDRSIIDNVSAFEALGIPLPAHLREAVSRYRYSERVFFTPPWEELFVNDGERRHSFADAQDEYERLILRYQAYGYEVVVIPKAGVSERADFIDTQLSR